MSLINKIINKTLQIILLIFGLVSVSYSTCPIPYKMQQKKVNGYSDVFDDLRQATNFKIEDYPSYTLDYFKEINSDNIDSNDKPLIEVITISESSDDELYIYTYQPLNYEIETKATAISISLGFSVDGQDLNPKIYDLYLASTYGVFNKYVVEKIDVSDELYRYYNFVAIYRDYIEEIDEVASGGEVENSEYGIEVGQQWCAYYQNNNIVYEMNTFETLEIEINLNSYVRFFDGITLGSLVGVNKAGDLHFIAFNALNYQIEHIYDADITYKIRTRSYDSFTGDSYGEWSEVQYKTLIDEEVEIKGEGLFGRSLKWNRISSSISFIENMESQRVNFIDSSKEKITESQWVFAFLETHYDGSDSMDIYQYKNWTEVDSVGILRIKFQDTNKKIYNLGVVSDLTNSTENPIGVGGGIDTEAMQEWFEKILMLIGVLILIIVMGFFTPIFSTIFNILIKCISLLIKGLFLIISAPFKLIGKTSKRKKKRK